MEYLLALVLLVSMCYAKVEVEEESFFPEYIHPCNFTDDDFEKCVKEQIEESLPYFAKGIPEYSVPSIDPVDLNDIVIDGNGLKLKFSDTKMHGLAGLKLTDLKIQLGGDNESFTLSLKGNLSLTAQYNADGRILILPIKGEGDAFINCYNIEVNISSNLTHVKGKDDKEHLKLLAPKYKYDIESTTFDLKNLFNGNKKLAETTLQFANENWSQLMDDLAPPVVKQIVKTIVKTINKFLSKVTIPRIIIGYKERL
ncbi:circadian clock-controlled protein daywake-like [Pararge aegeria]|uniref:Jg9031 protein n=1 Tax=Pararge aegeria aegeria TaxID=348720 RepID=A0A8S4RFK5_9NEOP|nr:circadian clock-controlled protein daywake-like [Pararge aegeria]CAH2234149.1 jg9031 [Pararge aegeria aegeria]